MKKALHQEELIFQLQQVIENLPGNIFWKDKNGRFLGCNKNVARILKLKSPRDIVGKTDEEMLGKEYADLVRKNNEKVIKTKKEITTEEIGFSEKGEEAIYLSTKQPLFGKNGKVIGLIGTSIDITERKKMELALKETKEKAEQANSAKNEFLNYTVAEIKQPLTELKNISLTINKNADADSLLKLNFLTNKIVQIIHDLESFAAFNLISKNQFSLDESNLPIKPEKITMEKLKKFCEHYSHANLTRRESECLFYLVRGMTTKQTGKYLKISPRTVEFYLTNAKLKLECSNKQQLITKIFEIGII